MKLACIVPGDPPRTRCLRSGGRMLSRILFSCSFVAFVGPRLLTTDEAAKANKSRDEMTQSPNLKSSLCKVAFGSPSMGNLVTDNECRLYISPLDRPSHLARGRARTRAGAGPSRSRPWPPPTRRPSPPASSGSSRSSLPAAARRIPARCGCRYSGSPGSSGRPGWTAASWRTTCGWGRVQITLGLVCQ